MLVFLFLRLDYRIPTLRILFYQFPLSELLYYVRNWPNSLAVSSMIKSPFSEDSSDQEPQYILYHNLHNSLFCSLLLFPFYVSPCSTVFILVIFFHILYLHRFRNVNSKKANFFVLFISVSLARKSVPINNGYSTSTCQINEWKLIKKKKASDNQTVKQNTQMTSQYRRSCCTY